MIFEQRTGPRLEQWDDETLTYRSWIHDELKEERPFTEGELAFVIRRQQDLDWLSRRGDAYRLLRLAFVSNKDYLAAVDAGTVNQAGHMQQIIRLTREMQGVLRLVVATSVEEDVSLDVPVIVVTGAPATGV